MRAREGAVHDAVRGRLCKDSTRPLPSRRGGCTISRGGSTIADMSVASRLLRPAWLEIDLEHTRIDLTTVPDASIGDEVVVIGRQGDAEISAAAVGTRHGHAPHGVALAVRDRVARVYLSGEKVVSIRTRLGIMAV
jgi:hypothetical protein